MKKRIVSILLSLCMMIAVAVSFSGCNLVHKDSKSYYDDVVAYVGDEKITRSEVLNMFNYYYYTQNLYYSYTAEQTYELTLEALIKNKVVLGEAKKQITLTIAQKNKIWQSVFDSVNSTIDGYEDEIRKLYGVEEREKDDDKEEKPKFEEYERTELGKTEDEVEETELKDKFTIPTEEGNKYRALAYKRYVNVLRESANTGSRKQVTADEAFQNELNRLYKYYEDQKYIELYWLKQEGDYTITDSAILERYNRIVNGQIQDFAVDGNYATAIKKLSENNSYLALSNNLILYHANGEYFTVQHLLLPFTTDASATLSSDPGYVTSKKAELEKEDAKEESYIEAFLALRRAFADDTTKLDLDYINPTTGEKNKDDDGNEVKKTLDDVKNAVSDMLAEYRAVWADSSKTDAEKEAAGRVLAQKFYKLKFSYSKDSKVTDLSLLMNIMGYAVPKDTETDSGLYPEFTEIANQLFAQFENPDAVNGKYNILTTDSVSGLHFIMINKVYNAGEVAESNIESLKNTYLSMVTNQTVYDYVYDILASEATTTLRNEKIQALYSQYKSSKKIKVLIEDYKSATK